MDLSFYPNMTITSHHTAKTLNLRIYKDIYTNISFLTKHHPTTKEFQEVFEENMFVKNNAMAVIHVSYYLLNTLDPVRLKQKITMWPVLQKSDEGRFRIELLKYFNELKGFYKNHAFPTLTMSHLITPKRFQFVLFMLRLSQLCVYMFLKKGEHLSNFLYEKVKYNKNLYVKWIENITKITESIKIDNKRDLEEFQMKFGLFQKEDNWISDQIQLNQEKLSLKQEELKEFTNLKDTTLQGIELNEDLILKEANSIKLMKETTNKIVEIIKKFFSDDFMFDNKQENIDAQDNVNLNDLLSNLNKLLRNKSVEMHSFANQDWERNTTKIQLINGILKTFITAIEQIHQNLIELDLQVRNMNGLQEPELTLAAVEAVGDSINANNSSLGLLYFNDD